MRSWAVTRSALSHHLKQLFLKFLIAPSGINSSEHVTKQKNRSNKYRPFCLGLVISIDLYAILLRIFVLIVWSPLRCCDHCPGDRLVHYNGAIMSTIMMTSSNGNIFRVTGPLCGEFTGPRWIPAQRPVTRSFDVFFDLRLNKRLSKQWWGWWFETL